MKKVFISQPRYLPIVPYLKRIAESDLFIVLDDTQRSARKFENRNILSDGKYITIPISGSEKQLISNAYVHNEWIERHLNKIYSLYPNAKKYEFLKWLYGKEKGMFTDIAIGQIKLLFLQLGITMPVVIRSSSCPSELKGKERIKELLKTFKADVYLCGGEALNQGINNEFLKDINCKVKEIPNDTFYPALHYILTEGIESTKQMIWHQKEKSI